MARFVTNEYKLDITPQGNYPVVYLSQFENGRQIKFIMMNRGRAFIIPSGLSASISGVKSNGGYYEHICEFDSRNIYVPVEDDMTDVSGRGVATIKFTDGDGDTVVSAKFVMNVQEATTDSGIEIPTVAETILQQILSEIREEAAKLDLDMDAIDAKIEAFKADINNDFNNFTSDVNGDIDTMNARLDNFLATQAGVSNGSTIETETLYTKPSDNSQSAWSNYIELSEDPRDYDYLVLTYGARNASDFYDYGNRIITPDELVDTSYVIGPGGVVKLLTITFTGDLYKNNNTASSFTPQKMNQYRLEIYRDADSYTRYRVMNTAAWWTGVSSASADGWFDSYVAEAAISKIVGIKIIPAGTDKDPELVDVRVGADGTTYNSAGEAVRSQVSDLKSGLSKINEVIALSKNALEMEWEEGSITMNGTKVASTAHRRTAYIVRLLKGSKLICKNGAKVRVVTFTMQYSYITVLDTATDYATSYTATNDQYAMFAINSTDTSDIAVVAPYQYRRIYTTISQELWSEGVINTGGNIVTATGRYYTLPFYVGKGTYIECIGDTKCRVVCYDAFDIDRRSKIAISDDWVGFYTVPQNCFIQIVLAAQYDADSIATTDLNKLHCNIVPAEHQDMRIQWELGGITLATGTDNTSTYRYRTLFFRAKAGDFISCRSGYTMVVYEYSREHPQNMRLVTSQSSWTSSYIVRTDCICRLAVKKDDGTEVVVSNLQTMITITSSASGNRLLNAKKTFNVPYTPYKSAGLVPQGIWTVTYNDVYSWYNALVDNDYVTKETLGNDQSGTYPIYAYRFKPSAVISSVVAQDSATVIPVKAYPVKFLLCTATHGSERPSVLALYNAMYNIVNNWQNDPVLEFIRHNCEIVVVPLVNPYGFINRTRGNSNGVDINRNYNTKGWQYGSSDSSNPYYRGASAASENETKLMQNLIMREPFDFVYDFHTHGNFTAYDQMYCWASCGQGYEQYTFEIGQAVTKSSNSGAIKNHGFDAGKMIGRNDVYSNYAMIADFADMFSFVSASPEVAYKIYDGSGSTNSDTELTDAVKSVNEEYIINSIIISANTMH